MQALLVYSTFPNAQAATAAARALLDARLAACVNIMPGMRALYRWEGALEEAEEVVLIAKTTVAAGNKVVDKLRVLHPYTCPCIITLDIQGGYAPFLEWITSETA